MPKKARELSALEVGRLRRDGFNPVGGVPGLGLQIAGPARSWILRFSFAGRRPEMGLGGFPEVTLAEARRSATEARALIRSGINPIEAARAAQRAEAARRAASKTLPNAQRHSSRPNRPSGPTPSTLTNGTRRLRSTPIR